MTTKITVSVNGNYKIPVREEFGETDRTTVVSGRGHDGPHVVEFYATHGGDNVLTIGPEESDNGD